MKKEKKCDRYCHLFKDIDYILSLAFRPQFRLALWLEWLPDNTFRVENMKRRVSLAEKAKKEEEEGSSGSGGKALDKETMDDYFQALYDSGKKEKYEILVKNLRCPM